MRRAEQHAADHLCDDGLREVQAEQPEDRANDAERQPDDGDARDQSHHGQRDRRDEPEDAGLDGRARVRERRGLQPREHEEQQQAAQERGAEPDQLPDVERREQVLVAGRGPRRHPLGDLFVDVAADRRAGRDLHFPEVADARDQVAADLGRREQRDGLARGRDVALHAAAQHEVARGGEEVDADLAVDADRLAGGRRVADDLRARADGDVVTGAEEVAADA